MFAVEDGDVLRFVAAQKEPYIGAIDGSFGPRVDWVTYPCNPVEP